ncbi:TIGR03668 family PPOX class F420-dependent oxidoreductase [Actinomadura barringtoniae]|uniref:TIGR03668 family PPOX class F420-dependent oxidoreductase n=1 Tax=Actinomadura barringtoniae TaxID=1427535 RepID=A0A939PIR5_9ACTN|nr:TIGR03668 family PPOX class F420-dependent oxidoreductase [Actinomadura barringtoniae]MBO2453657.1 TIGR03668 family PPOX class F420-dependent oxidoreductase [Actinomadura barringtoniae]
MPRLPQDVARRRLMTVQVLRLATVDERGVPHLIPVTFAIDRGTLYTAVDHKPKSSRDLKRLANIRANPHVTLLADHYADDWSALWWVRLDGHARVIDDADEMAAPIGLLADRYAQYREHPPEGPVIAVTIDGWTGWSATAETT